MNCKALLLIDNANLSTNVPIAKLILFLFLSLQILSIFVLIALILFCVNSDMITVISNLQIIKQNLSVNISKLTQNNMSAMSKNIDKICMMKQKRKMSNSIETLISKLSTSINNNALLFLKSNVL